MTESVVDYSEQPLAVEVDDVTMIFNMASGVADQPSREYFIKLAKHELFFEEFRALKQYLVRYSPWRGCGSSRHQWLRQVYDASRLSLACLSLARAAR